MKRYLLLALTPLLITSATLLSACGSNNGVDFGAPAIATIVDSATPTSLKTATAYSPVKTFIERYLTPSSAVAASSTCSAAGNVSSGCGTASEYLTFLKSEVFTKSTSNNVAATLYFRYWVDVLDAAMAATNTRLKANKVTPTCVSQTAVAVDYTFNVNGTAVTVSPKLQCWETQSGVGAATQNMAFGKDTSYFYLVFRTNDNATTSGSGIRIVIAKAALDGSTADIWFLGASYQMPSGGGTVERRGNVQRVLANKTTGAFTFNTVEEDDTAKGYLFGSFYANTDGTKIAIEAAYGSGSTLTDVTTMTRAVPYCANVSALTTNLGASSCATLDGAHPPTGFGLTTAMTNSSTGSATLWQASNTTEVAFETAIDTITAIDYTAKGVGKFEASTN